MVIGLVLFLGLSQTQAQWSAGSLIDNIYHTENVSIGTTATVSGAKLNVSTQSGNTAIFSAPYIGNISSHIHWGATGDWFIRSAVSNGNVVIQDTDGKLGIGAI